MSLTDRCNYRCTYCMPEEGVELQPRQEILDFEEIERLVRVFASLGVERVRLTGGEPTVRKRVVDLVERLAAVEGIADVAMTSNGHRFPELAGPLARAGLRGVNISVDTVDLQKFRTLTRRGDLERVTAGIGAAQRAGLEVKLNAVALRGVNDGEIAALCKFAWDRGTTLRFIEHMPMSGGAVYDAGGHLAAAEIRAEVEREFGDELVPDSPGARARGPARYWRLRGRPSCRLGVISAMSEHFCDTCNRVRLSAMGDLHTCLAYDDAVGLRQILRSGGSDDDLRQVIRDAVAGKREGHGFQTSGAGAPSKHMISIGG